MSEREKPKSAEIGSFFQGSLVGLRNPLKPSEEVRDQVTALIKTTPSSIRRNMQVFAAEILLVANAIKDEGYFAPPTEHSCEYTRYFFGDTFEALQLRVAYEHGVLLAGYTPYYNLETNGVLRLMLPQAAGGEFVSRLEFTEMNPRGKEEGNFYTHPKYPFVGTFKKSDLIIVHKDLPISISYPLYRNRKHMNDILINLPSGFQQMWKTAYEWNHEDESW